jgi:hypothetical protein
MTSRLDPGAVPTAIGGVVELVFEDGEAVEAAVPIALGHPSRPVAMPDMIEKFVACAARAAVSWSRPTALRLADRLLAIDECDDISALFQMEL